MGRCLAPSQYKWDGENADFTPESDNIPWSFVPDKKVTVEDVKYILSSYYQGTPYNPYSNQSDKSGRKYRTIGINRTGVTSVCQIRDGVPEEIRAIEWICFGSTSFDALIPLYTNVSKMPKYVSEVTLDASTENFYWASRLIGALTDHNYASSIPFVERYQNAVFTEGRRIVLEFDRKMTQSGDYTLTQQANEQICRMAREKSTDTLNRVLHDASLHMKNGYNRGDN